jgi:acyl carrier protein
MLDRGAGLLGDRLLGLVKQILEKNSITRPLAIKHPLIEAGLTSIDMVNLMLTVEAEFDIVIPESEITPENFHTISTIEALILKINPRISGPWRYIPSFHQFFLFNASVMSFARFMPGWFLDRNVLFGELFQCQGSEAQPLKQTPRTALICNATQHAGKPSPQIDAVPFREAMRV